MTARPVVRVRRTAAAVAVLLASACATSGPPQPAVADLAGQYTGTVSVEGQTLYGSLEITQEGPALELRFSFPDVALTARGEGTAHATGFTGEVSYTLTCPGVATFEGTLDPEADRLAGTVRATDCDGTISGTFRFTRSG